MYKLFSVSAATIIFSITSASADEGSLYSKALRINSSNAMNSYENKPAQQPTRWQRNLANAKAVMERSEKNAEANPNEREAPMKTEPAEKKNSAIVKARKSQATQKDSSFYTGWTELEIKGDELCYSWEDSAGIPQSVCKKKQVAKELQVVQGGERVVCMWFRMGNTDRIRMNRPCAQAFLNTAEQMDQIARLKRSEANTSYEGKAATIRKVKLEDANDG